jgi:hypothetical protein
MQQVARPAATQPPPHPGPASLAPERAARPEGTKEHRPSASPAKQLPDLQATGRDWGSYSKS